MKFCDINLKITDKDVMVKAAKEIGFQTIATCITENAQLDELYKVGEQHGVTIIRRVNLKPTTVSQLMGELHRWRANCELIGVECRSIAVTRQAAKDRRVDLLNFPIQNLKFLRKIEARLISNVTLEVIFNSIIKIERQMIPKAIGMLQQTITLAKKYNMPIIGSSGAANILEMKTPRDMAAFFQILGLSVEESLNAFSRNPHAIIEKNKSKLNSEYIGDGVQLIRGGRA